MSDLILTTNLATLAQAANHAAQRHTFEDYTTRKSQNTLERQKDDLACFAQFLATVGADAGDLQNDPDAWAGIEWGLITAWAGWMVQQGYAVGSINVRLSTVRAYARLAHQAGAMSAENCNLIRYLAGYSHREGKRIDQTRDEADLPTRIGNKKGDAVSITPGQAALLKAQPANIPQGRRDALLLCLLLDHGLRCGEVAGLAVTDFDLARGELRFYREKVDKTQTHRMSKATLAASKAYFEHDAPAIGPALRSSLKSGALGKSGMSKRAISERVEVLGLEIGLESLSPHDCRHYWATQAARNGTQIDRLQDAGGWASPAMPLRYVEAATIANDGVSIGD